MLKSKIKTLILQTSALVCRNSRSKILYYHDVYDDVCYTEMGTSLSLFKHHIETMRREGFEIVDVISKPDNQVMLCFDDGFRGIFDTRHFFYDNSLKPTVFLPITLIGQPGYLAIDEIMELQAHDFRFQCHAWSHTDLTVFSVDELKRELGDSKEKLQEMLESDIDEICFPIGYFSGQVLDECHRYGYRRMYSSIPGNYDASLGHEDLVPRNLVQSASPAQIRAILRGGNQILQNRYKKMHFRG